MMMGWDEDGDRVVNKGGDGPRMGREQGWGQGHSGGLCRGGEGVTLGDRVVTLGVTLGPQGPLTGQSAGSAAPQSNNQGQTCARSQDSGSCQ